VLRLDGELGAAKRVVALEPFALAYADMKWSGTVAYSAGEPDRPARVDAKLVAEKPDLAQLAALLPRAADLGNLDVAASLDARSPKLFGGGARRLDAALSLSAGSLSIERLSLEDFDGLNLRARGRLAAWRDRLNGRVDIETEASKPEGVVSLVRAAFATGETPALAKRIAAAAIPLQMKGTLAGDGTSAEVGVEIGGSVGAADAAVSARFDSRSAALGEARIVAEARDAAQLVALLGLPWPEPHAGQGRLELAIGRAKEGAFPLKASLAYPGIDLSGQGDLRAGADGKIEPRVDLRLQATDARALSLAAARTAASVVPADGTARLLRADDAFVLDNIALGLGGSHVRGRLAVKGFERPSLSGALSLDRAELSVLLALALGRAGDSAASPWPDRPLAAAALEDANGTVEIESAVLGLVGPFVANGARLKLRFAGSEVAIDDFSGELAGGKLSGAARFVRASPLVVEGNFSLSGGDVARLVAPGAARAAVRGRANLALGFSAQGNAPAAIAANLTGQGNLALEGLEIDKLDPEALTKVVAAPNAPPLSEAEATEFLAFGLQHGPLRVAKAEMPIAVTSGVARAAKTRVIAGPVAVTSEASLDLAKLDLDAAIGLEAASKNGPRAEATIRWRGPLADPQRKIDVSALVAALSLQAMDAEMKKIEGRPTASPTVAPATNAPVPKRRPAEIPPPVAADLPPLPPPVEVGPAPGNARPRPNPSLQ